MFTSLRGPLYIGSRTGASLYTERLSANILFDIPHLQYLHISLEQRSITYYPGMIFGVPSADRQEIVRTSRVDFKSFAEAAGAELHAFIPV